MKLPSIFNILMMAVTPMLAIVSCQTNRLWDELPLDISRFINEYFPNGAIDSYSSTPTSYHVRISDGPGLTFGQNYQWEEINGYGMPLSGVLLFDQLPPHLYKYLEETSNLDQVFVMERTSRIYTIVLLDSTLTYDISTQAISSDLSERA